MRSKERYFNVEKSSNKSENIIKKISEKTGLSPKIFVIAALLAAGVIALMLSEFSDSKKPDAEDVSTTVPFDSDAYISELENRLISIISAIDGAGETRVMVTLESGGEDFYLNNADYGENIEISGENSYEKKDDYVIVDGSYGQGGIVVRRAEPRVRGVAVVCKGAGSETVKAEITRTVTALLDISSARVSVAKMN